MSLQVWLPFTDGTLKQQGLDNAIVTSGGTVSLTNTGKLGKCVTFGSAAGGLVIPASTMTSFSECSVAFWFKINGWGSNYDTYFQAGTGSTPWNNYIFGFLRNGTNSTVCFTIGNGSAASNATYLTSAFSTGVWYHVVLTYEAGKCRIYLNGNLDHEYNTSFIPAFNKITKITLGRCNNDSNYQTQCSMNDFRIYDHCLSPMEVKELSKGLVLHYPLNRGGWGQENILKGTGLNVFASGVIDWTTTDRMGSGSGGDGTFSITEDNTCPIGIYSWNVLNNTTGNRDYQQTNQPYIANQIYTASLYAKGTGTLFMRSWNNTAGNQVIYKTYHLTDEWKFYTWTFTATSAMETDKCSLHLGLAGAGSINMCGMKLEEGSVATPWCPNSSDVLATTVGLNGTIEYDCSGFCNNGIRTGTFSWTSDTPKYTVSQNCLGTNYIYLTPPSTEIQTMAVWVKWNTIPSGQSVILVDNGSGIGLGLYSGGILCSTSGAGNSYAFSKANLIANTWYHFVVVKTGATTRKLYINGVEQTANSNSSTWSYSVNQLQLGKRSTTSDGFIGKLSDFRAYTTALSADDVKSLYQNSAYIDSSGNVYGAVHSEV